MAPPTGLGLADAFSYDESLNWQHNEPINEEQPGRRKSLFRKVGLTTQRKRAHAEDDLPPFVFRQIPYDTWRKHYAKDADGNYRGTHAPAEDCLLKPEDVQKWRLGDPVTKADKWTRGREVLPVYSEVREEGAVPEYQVDHPDVPPHTQYHDPVMTPDDDRLAEFFDGRDTIASAPARRQPSSASTSQQPATTTTTIADGKTAAEIIAEAEARPKQKTTWKQMLSKGAQMAMAGN